MKAQTKIGCIVTAIAGLAAMCLCSLIFSPAWSAFVGFLIFICFSGIIAAIALRDSSYRVKVSVFCIFIGLVGIAVMQLSALLIPAPFSGIAGFAVFLLFGIVIAVILTDQKNALGAEYQQSLKDRCEQDAAVRLLRALRGKNISDTEIRRLIAEKFSFSEDEMNDLFDCAK